MKLRDHTLLVRYMQDRDMSQARLGRYAECSRQFIHQLCAGDKNTCTPAVAKRIEEALGVLEGTLFMPGKSHQASTSSSMTRQKAA